MPDAASVRRLAHERGLRVEMGECPSHPLIPGMVTYWLRVKMPDGEVAKFSETGRGPEHERRSFARFEQVVGNLPTGDAAGTPAVNGGVGRDRWGRGQSRA